MTEQLASQITVFIAEDQEIIRVGLTTMLASVEGISVIGYANDGQSAVRQCLSMRPGIVIMDIGMPVMDGIEATKLVKEQLPETKVIMLTTFERDQEVFASLAAGADGYCLKNVSKEQLTTAIKTVSEGAAWLDPAIAGRVLKASASPAGAAQPNFTGSLSEREMDVLRLLVDGLTNQEIANRLVVSVETVKTHIRHIMDKLAVSDRTQAAVKAVRQGLV